MSASKTLIINCGASHVSVSTFSANGADLLLEDFVIEELDYDYSIDEEWLGALSLKLGDILRRKKFHGPATLISPGYQLLTKTIKVPHVEAAKQAQIIAFEAQQNIPYPLSDVVWDYQVIADDGVETEVILIAIKSDAINSFCQQVSGFGISPERISAASILDYNAYKLSYQDNEEDTLLVNIGARSSNLIFINEDGFFIRNIALGGNSLTQNLADNLGKGFTEAEKVKIAFFSGQTSYEPDHPSVQILQNNAQIFQRRMGQEITRSIVNFRRQRGAKAPARILLTGRGSLLPGLPEFLAEQQKMPVEYFDPAQGISVGGSLDKDSLGEDLYSLGEVIGEASRLVLPEPVAIDLLPSGLAEEMRFSKQRPFIALAAILLALATVPPILAFKGTSSKYEEATRQVQSKVAPLNTLHSEIVSNRESATALRKDVGDLEELVNARSNWIIFFTDLQQRLQDVQDVWLENLQLDRASGDRLKMTGRILITNYDPNNPTASNQEAADRINRLLESFKESEFIKDVANLRIDTSMQRILKFEFTLITNPEKPL
ncbi:pilus assembly protein PilM [Ruficoccus amylovorans]|uniref:Pilus assembly protein PilM n=1 Tax=Ruficoccus amylovorans TaxID=1804625 RepID=A0A842HHG7_9BACT|nr:pilus assembly protein PilM [Ruficoccus amylovorans]MBC2594681.1 pilus assembly protein PilM [Ruficoccus amylovorans]